MRITTPTPDELRIDHIPWKADLLTVGIVLFLTFFGLIFLSGGDVLLGLAVLALALLVAAIMLATSVERCQLWLDRRARTLVHRRRTIRGLTETARPLADLILAHVETIQHERRGAKTHRVLLRLEGTGDLPLTVLRAGGTGADQVARTINRWIGREGAG
jgi:hypothetical protein